MLLRLDAFLFMVTSHRVLPTDVSLTPNGVVRGVPTQAGNFPFTVRLADAQSQIADKTLTLQVLTCLPPPSVHVHKTKTVAVPRKVMDYFVLVETCALSRASCSSQGRPENAGCQKPPVMFIERLERCEGKFSHKVLRRA